MKHKSFQTINIFSTLLCLIVTTPLAAIANTEDSKNDEIGRLEESIEGTLRAYYETQDEARITDNKRVHEELPVAAMEIEGAFSPIEDRSSFADAGLDIVSSTTEIVSINDEISNTDGIVNIEALITTKIKSFSIDGQIIESGWTDSHMYEIDINTSNYSVVSDTVIDDYQENSQDDYDSESYPDLNPSPEDAAIYDLGEEAFQLEPTQISPLTNYRASTQAGIDAKKFTTYAKKYTSGKYASVAQGNPNFPTATNNCANFASQTLKAGGWQLKGGVNPRDSSNWTYKLSGPKKFSRSWSEASSLYSYAKNKKGWKPKISVSSAIPGDLIFTDWDPNGKADGKIDHVMVVSGKQFAKPFDPLISQKSPNRHNITLSKSMEHAKKSKTKVVWYALGER